MNNNYAQKAVILARVSTEEQRGDSHYSIPAQLRILRDYATKGGKFKAIKEWEEYQFDESASGDKRNKFRKAIEVVETATETIAIICERVDRFQRSFRETVEFDKLRKDGEVELHFVNENLVIHRNSPASELVYWMNLVTFAYSYTAFLSDNVKRSGLERLNKGYPLSYVPTGYCNIDTQTEERKIIKKIIIDEEKAPFVKHCFRLYASGNYSLESLAETMNNEGFTVKTKMKRVNGKLEKAEPREITKTNILKILRNPFYYGEFYCQNHTTGKRELWSNKGINRDLEPTYEPLVSKKLFKSVQAILDNHNSRADGFRKNNFKFGGLITCGFCGCKLTPEEMSRTYKNKNSKKADTVYYHCTSGKKISERGYYEKHFPEWAAEWREKTKGHKSETKEKRACPCPQKWWKEEEIEEFVLEELGLMHYDDSIYDMIRDLLKDDLDEKVFTLDKQLKGLRVEKDKTDELMRAIRSSIAMETDIEMRQEFRKDYDILRDKRKELESEIRYLEDAKNVDVDETVEKLVMCGNLKEFYEKTDLKRQHELLSWCFSDIETYRGYRYLKSQKRATELEPQMRFILNEPFATLRSLKIDEMLPLWDKEYKEKVSITKVKDSKAS